MCRVAIATILLVGWLTQTALGNEPARPTDTALAVDEQLASEINGLTTQGAPRAGDEIFLRRLTLDLVGRNPTIEEITAFAIDPAPTKRIAAAERLLAQKQYGENWSHYWRDVIMYRRSEDRALIASPALTTYLADELNKNTPWDKLASAFITAEGDVTENGATALIMAQQGRPEETVAEIARIFLGIQIQCAQCHDHPTDQWKREQFHELAAFFPRVSVRPNRDQTKRSFDVVADDNFPRFARPMANNRFRGSAEHYMPDLENPAAKGTLIQPKFFVTGEQLRLGAKDETRRDSLAKWLTAPENPWFAKALVNRVWSELVGEGFYEPVDDMGPDRECHAPKTLDLLSQQFAASGYDIKWLLLTIVSTDAYQRASQARRNPDQQPFAANVPQRLRGDQLFSNLMTALELSERGPAGGIRGPYGFNRGPRSGFNLIFGYDPSIRRDEVAGSIPQALAMMNSPNINLAISARGRTSLSRMLTEIKDDRALVAELYLKTLAREPTPSEVQTCLQYINEVNSRAEAFEDIQWSLVNSTEFLHRR